MNAQQRITDYEVVDLGIQDPQYFTGFSTASTAYRYALYGAGDTYNEALDAALETIAQMEDQIGQEDLARIYQEESVSESINSRVSAYDTVRLTISNAISPNEYIDTDCDHEAGAFCEACLEATVDYWQHERDEHSWYYVGIRYNVGN